MKTKKRFSMDTLATLATTATDVPEPGEGNDKHLPNLETRSEKLYLVDAAHNQYLVTALECLRRLQTKYASNLEAGGYDPKGANVSIRAWKTECARSGLSSDRLSSIQSLLDSSVIFEHPYLHEIPENEKQKCPVSEAPEDEDVVSQQLSIAIADMCITLEEVLASQLFDEHDFEQILAGNMSQEGLRMYIGSWLLADRSLPFVVHHDWEERLVLRKTR